ncbi:hypothetical protein [Streptomyces sp. NPDC001903]|uniref:hypothetical protein n=1 Tax=Streptomyces sp. NPDC001903 TaxID=3364622 RepID=UPI003687B5BA
MGVVRVRVAVVDEREDVLDGRVGWLRAAGHTAVGYSFEAAFEETDWHRFDTVVLDGRDDREHPILMGSGELPDRFLGPRVAQRIRELAGRERPVIILVSSYARTHPELSLRCQEAGVDYAFDYLDVPSSAHFVRAVESPLDMGPRKPVDWRALGFVAPPRIGDALAAAENSRAAPPLVSDGASAVGVSPYERRRLRETLGGLLPVPVFRTGERRRLAHGKELRSLLRRLLGLRATDDPHGARDGSQ